MAPPGASYQVPYLLLDRLSVGQFCRESGCPGLGAWRSRPLRDITLLIEAHGADEQVCIATRPSKACAPALHDSRGWRLKLLRTIGEAARAS